MSLIGLITTPSVQLFDFSGFRLVLPPKMPLYWPAKLSVMWPYWLAVTPVRAHCSSVAVGVAPAQGSESLSYRPMALAENSSMMFGARVALWALARTFIAE